MNGPQASAMLKWGAQLASEGEIQHDPHVKGHLPQNCWDPKELLLDLKNDCILAYGSHKGIHKPYHILHEK